MTSALAYYLFMNLFRLVTPKIISTKASFQHLSLKYLKANKLMIIAFLSILLLIVINSVYQTGFSSKKESNKFSLETALITQKNITIDDITSSNEVTFSPTTGSYINLGKRSFSWLKLTLNNEKINKKQNQILVFKKNRIRTPIELYYLTHDKLWAKQVIQDNPQFHHNIVTRLPTGLASNTLYLKLHGQYLRGSFYLFQDPAFFEDLQLSSLYSGLFFGMLALFFCYHLMLYIKLKEPSYLAYSTMLFMLGLWFLSGQGWLEYLFPNLNFLKNKTVVLGALLIISIAEFAKQYLNIKILSYKLNNGLLIAQVLLGCLLLARLSISHLLPSALNQAAYGLGLIVCFFIFVSCFCAAVMGVKKQQTAAGYYLVATIMFFVMASIMGLSAGNIIDFHFSWRLLQLSCAIEIIIFSAGLVSIYYQQQQNEKQIEQQLQLSKNKLLKQLEISNALKDKVLNNIVDHKLFPELAKITPILSDIIYIQALGNDCQVVYKKNHRKAKIELTCNLQNLIDSFGNEFLIRIHKSYLINPVHSMSLQRRTSADYDLHLANESIPVGRKYLTQIKSLV